MHDFWNCANEILSDINGVIWGVPMVLLMAGTGIVMSIGTGFFQVLHIRHWFSATIGSLFSKNKSSDSKNGTISPFQAVCTALAATIGTGNIAGVAMAVSVGGAGAVFWMWVSALLGMMTAYAENVLGIHYRRKIGGKCVGGPMYYIEHGVGNKLANHLVGKVLASMFCIFCVLASFGMGNLVQVNSLSEAVHESFGISRSVVSCVVAVLVSLIIIGGTSKIGRVTEKIVPFMAGFYIFGALLFFVLNYREIPRVFSSVFTSAFSGRAVGGAVFGIVSKKTVEVGFKRGVFSNEAGIGSAALAHSSSSESEPAVQGMWGIFAVFFDTVVLCTLTAFVLLSCTTDAPSYMQVPSENNGDGYACIDKNALASNGSDVLLITPDENPVTGYTNIVSITDRHGTDSNLNGQPLSDKHIQKIEGVALVTYAFSQKFGRLSGKLVAISIVLFAFSTIIGWSFYGLKAWEYLFGSRRYGIYKILFTAITALGGSLNMNLIWSLADCFNGLMAVPNLIALLLLSGTVFSLTKKYKKENMCGK